MSTRRFTLAALAVLALAGCQKASPGKLDFKGIDLTGAEYARQLNLTDQDGRARSLADFKGKVLVVFFGYTQCPDVCPTTMAESVQWRADLGIKPEQLRTIFVTVDPERDTKDVLKEYLGGFDPDVIGLVGTPEQTEAAKASFGVMSEKDDSADKEFYLVNHTATVFLIGRNGEFEGTIAYGENTDTAVAKVEKLVKG
jgi:protein SCO1